MTFHPDSLPDLTGKVYIVTGVATIPSLVSLSMAHTSTCAHALTQKAKKAASGIKERYPKVNISILEMDHTSLSAVVSAAKLFLSKETALHGLVNNAGIMATPIEMTEDGYEAQWQTNYLAHWVFTSYLVPLMLNTSKGLPSGAVRIVNLSSSGHYQAPKGGINFADTSLPNEGGITRYGQSKLGKHLPRQNAAQKGEIWTAIVHPGFVDSQIGDRAEIPTLLRQFFSVFGALGGRVDGDKGAWTSVFCVASPDMKESQSGTYFQRTAEAGWQSRLAKDEKLAEKLEEWTKEEMRKGGWVGQ
ncbi:hypothetical protein NW754_007166 [Fusarium falciforme]|nr:hypothetical protein NW754_007166 [Fusarium falciforme]